MKIPFDLSDGLVIVDAAILGTKKDTILRLCLDTGAQRTTLSDDAVQRVGLLPPKNADRFPLQSASGKITAPLVVLPKIFALNTLKEDFSVYVHTLPMDAAVDGLLGLDFLRGHVLTLDFKAGEISFE